MIRGKDNSIYTGLREKLRQLAPELYRNEPSPPPNALARRPLIITEGKSDWKHLKAAFLHLKRAGKIACYDVEFQEDETPQGVGNDQLLRQCRALARVKQHRTTICVFDRDESKIVREVTNESGNYKKWGNSVYSFALPVPEHRKDSPEVSVELLYSDEDLKRKDPLNRRLFLSPEFSPESGRHVSEDLVCPYPRKEWGSKPRVIDDRVFDRDGRNCALSKDDFAENVLSEAENFKDMDFNAFAEVFDIIARIVADDYSED